MILSIESIREHEDVDPSSFGDVTLPQGFKNLAVVRVFTSSVRGTPVPLGAFVSALLHSTAYVTVGL